MDVRADPGGGVGPVPGAQAEECSASAGNSANGGESNADAYAADADGGEGIGGEEEGKEGEGEGGSAEDRRAGVQDGTPDVDAREGRDGSESSGIVDRVFGE